MAIVKMQKVAVLAHHSLREEVIQHLHDKGVMQISQSAKGVEIDHTEVNFRIAELQFAIQTLREHATKQVIAAAQKRSTSEEIVLAARHTNVRGIVDRLHNLESEDTEAERAMQEQQNLLQTLAPWAGFSLPLNTPAETKKTLRMPGMLPAANVPALQTALTGHAPRCGLETVSEEEGTAYVMAVIWKADIRAFEETATRHGWTAVQLPVMEGTARTVHEEAALRLRTLEQDRQKRQVERARLASELPNLLKTETYVHWLTEKQGAREAISTTNNTIMLLGWMPAKSMEEVETGLHRISPAIAILKVKPDEDEEPPVLLRHNRIIAPFVSVTSLYGLPQPAELDPTPALSPFFILFFALCLTDAGYGLVLFTIFSIVLWRIKKPVHEAPLIWLLWMSGIVTFFVSIPFGGWFGLTPDQVPAFLTRQTAEGLLFKGQIWNLSAQSGINFLQNLALALGMTHLMFGMFLAGYHKWIHGKKAAAFWQDFTSHLLLGAAGFSIAAPLFEATAQMQNIALYALYGAVALAIWGKGYGSPWYLRPVFGLLGLMNFTIGMLSNGLSYLRILALGLVTGAMALAVNQVAVEMGKLFPVWLAIPVIVIIFIGGHLVSIALNTLGSFIHAGRLQFIEFFSQFFEGGGKPYIPFRRSSP